MMISWKLYTFSYFEWDGIDPLGSSHASPLADEPLFSKQIAHPASSSIILRDETWMTVENAMVLHSHTLGSCRKGVEEAIVVGEARAKEAIVGSAIEGMHNDTPRIDMSDPVGSHKSFACSAFCSGLVQTVERHGEINSCRRGKEYSSRDQRYT